MDKNTNTSGQLSDKDVIARTAALWKYNPVPESPEPYPESVCKAAFSDGFEVIGAAVRGKKHKHEGTNCDDGFAFDFADGNVIGVVADGAGSKAFSRIGARAACDAVVKYVKARLDAIKRDTPDYRERLGMSLESAEFGAVCSKIAGMLRDSYAEAFAAVEAAYEKRRDNPEFEQALGRKPELKDFSCTLLAAAVIPVETENGREYLTAAVQLGDGMIASVDENAAFASALTMLGAADSGSFAGETEFLTSEQTRSAESLMSRTKIRRGKMTSLMLMSDGVADDYYPNNPQLLRLAADLKLNGIMPIDGAEGDTDIAVPEPAAYPWVNDSDVSYALQYAKNVMNECGLTLEQLWDNKQVQKKASLAAFGTVHEKEPQEMLKVWLDNYAERGSFDDRTLLIIKLKD
ncbi:MAG: protein phosphatase 2C domain-containing protein [Oscillospiraceae bacterium]|nr:protein phosphatase 2C domain-containing protein [Oscillospiraceae bacterium]